MKMNEDWRIRPLASKKRVEFRLPFYIENQHGHNMAIIPYWFEDAEIIAQTIINDHNAVASANRRLKE